MQMLYNSIGIPLYLNSLYASGYTFANSTCLMTSREAGWHKLFYKSMRKMPLLFEDWQDIYLAVAS